VRTQGFVGGDNSKTTTIRTGTRTRTTTGTIRTTMDQLFFDNLLQKRLCTRYFEGVDLSDEGLKRKFISCRILPFSEPIRSCLSNLKEPVTSPIFHKEEDKIIQSCFDKYSNEFNTVTKRVERAVVPDLSKYIDLVRKLSNMDPNRRPLALTEACDTERKNLSDCKMQNPNDENNCFRLDIAEKICTACTLCYDELYDCLNSSTSSKLLFDCLDGKNKKVSECIQTQKHPDRNLVSEYERVIHDDQLCEFDIFKMKHANEIISTVLNRCSSEIQAIGECEKNSKQCIKELSNFDTCCYSAACAKYIRKCMQKGKSFNECLIDKDCLECFGRFQSFL
jgi:hypothetical protein